MWTPKVGVCGSKSIDLILEIAGGECLPDLFPLVSLRGKIERLKSLIPMQKKFVAFPSNHQNWQTHGRDLDSTKGKWPWEVNVPSFRSEVDRPIDLVEEFLRIHGTKELQDSSVSFPSTFRENDPTYDFVRRQPTIWWDRVFKNVAIIPFVQVKFWLGTDLDIEKLALANPLSSTHIFGLRFFRTRE